MSSRLVGSLAVFAFAVTPLAAQQSASDSAQVHAVIDSALAAVSRSDFAALSTYMTPESSMFSVARRDSLTRYSAMPHATIRQTKITQRFTERGFGHQIWVAGAIASAWVPYDFYTDGKWSHCGIDVFVLMKVQGAWKIVSLAYSKEQPPACAPHPGGPPPA